MAQTARHRWQRRRIVEYIIPQAVIRFLVKNEDYGDGSEEFGLKGEVIEIGRKYKKLKSALWDEQPLKGEPIEEVIDDMIGHLFILREQLDYRENVEVLPTKTGEFDHADWASAYGVATQHMGSSRPGG